MSHETNVIKLRPHHMWGCLLAFDNSDSYSDEFLAHFNEVTLKVNGAPVIVELTLGPDNICEGFGHCKPFVRQIFYHCERADIIARDMKSLGEMNEYLARSPLAATLNLPWKAGRRIQLTDDLLKLFREGFRENATRAGCKQCIWGDDPGMKGGCGRDAAKGFPNAILQRGLNITANPFVILQS